MIEGLWAVTKDLQGCGVQMLCLASQYQDKPNPVAIDNSSSEAVPCKCSKGIGQHVCLLQTLALL